MATVERYKLSDDKTIRYRVRYRTPERRQTDKRGFTTKKEAEIFAATVEVAKLNKEYVAPAAGRVTVEAIYELWQASWLKLKETTKSTRESNWHKHVQPRWGAVRVSDVDHDAVQEWVGIMAKESGAATIENALGILRMVMAKAIAGKKLTINPTDGVSIPRRTGKRRGYLTHDQVQQLAKAIGDRAVVIGFLSYTGLRWGEMAALKVAEVSLPRRRVNVANSVTEVRGKLAWSAPKTWETRTVPFPAFLAGAVAELVEGKGPDDLVFTASAGQVLRVSTFRNRVFAPAVAACQEADPHFPRITPHDLRHTAASLAISAGANVKAVQTMLGHKSAAMTLDTYSDLFADDLDAVADHLNHVVTTQVVGNMWAPTAADHVPDAGK